MKVTLRCPRDRRIAWLLIICAALSTLVLGVCLMQERVIAVQRETYEQAMDEYDTGIASWELVAFASRRLHDAELSSVLRTDQSAHANYLGRLNDLRRKEESLLAYAFSGDGGEARRKGLKTLDEYILDVKRHLVSTNRR